MEPTCCNNPSCCFFCTMKEPDPSLRTSGISTCFREMPLRDDQEHVLVLSGLWNIAMTQPDDPEFPSLGIFECMASLIQRGVHDRKWLLRDQNIYIPYYAAHVIGSYTMNKPEFAEKAVKSGVVSPLMELLRGKVTWVEQRVAVRALGHLASYETTFHYVAKFEEEIVELAMDIASNCLDHVYVNFVGVKDKEKKNQRLKYHCDLLTRGVGGSEMENRKAEEWASQLQCWSIFLLNCIACKGRCLNLICKQGFLKDLSEMWGGLMNQTSPAGVGLIRILCYSNTGRKSIAESKHVLESLCNLCRSSDDWQYMGIDCLLLLLNDPDTRFKVMEISALFLVDLIEIKTLRGREKLGEAITEALLQDYYRKPRSKFKYSKKVQTFLQEVWELKAQRAKIAEEELEQIRVLVGLLKDEGNQKFYSGEIEEATIKYTEALGLCPLKKMRKERMVIYSNRAQCFLLLRDPDSAIRDSTRALSLSVPANSHNKSLWRRSQAYDMKGLAKESLLDCIMFVNGFISVKVEKKRGVKIPYYAARMISKQMNATWLFAAAESKMKEKDEQVEESDGCESRDREDDDDIIIEQNQISKLGLSTIVEEGEPSNAAEKGRWRTRGERRKSTVK